MRTQPVVVGAVLLTLIVAGSYGQTVEEKKGTLIVNLMDNLGERLPAGRLSIVSSQGSTAYSSEVARSASVPLPYGRYTVSFETGFFQPVRREVVIDQPECFIILAAHMDRIVLDTPHDPVKVSLRVIPSASCSSDGFLWAKLVGVFSEYAAERRFLSAGFALFEPVEVGTYLVMVLDGRNVRATKVFKTDRRVTVVELPLSPCE
jgi:hypothetical protein